MHYLKIKPLLLMLLVMFGKAFIMQDLLVLFQQFLCYSSNFFLTASACA